MTDFDAILHYDAEYSKEGYAGYAENRSNLKATGVKKKALKNKGFKAISKQERLFSFTQRVDLITKRHIFAIRNIRNRQNTKYFTKRLF